MGDDTGLRANRDYDRSGGKPGHRQAGQQPLANDTPALPGVIPAEGGVPLTIGGTVVGGLGISGVRSFQDGQIATSGAAALN